MRWWHIWSLMSDDYPQVLSIYVVLNRVWSCPIIRCDIISCHLWHDLIWSDLIWFGYYCWYFCGTVFDKIRFPFHTPRWWDGMDVHCTRWWDGMGRDGMGWKVHSDGMGWKVQGTLYCFLRLKRREAFGCSFPSCVPLSPTTVLHWDSGLWFRT